MVIETEDELNENAIKIFIGNLSFKSESGDIEKLLIPYCEVLSVEIAKDRVTGKSRGFAFATIVLSESSNLYDLDGLVLEDRSLKINDAEKNRKKKQNKKKKKSAF